MFISRPPPELPDRERERHASWRRYTRKYRRKQSIVRDVWLVSGALMLVVSTGGALILALGTAFISFMILDETR